MSYNNKLSDFELIHGFFEFGLKEQEIIDFEERLKNNKQFAEQSKAYCYMENKMNNEFMKTSFEQHQTRKQKWKEDLLEEDLKQKFRRSGNIRLAIAASISLLLISTFLLWQSENSINHNQLAQDYWESYSEESIMRTMTDEEQENEVVQISLEKLIKGQDLFQKGDNTAAIDTFQVVIGLKDGGYKDLAYWYQALVHLSMENIGAAKENLEQIIELGYPIANTDAKKLLEELNSK